MFDKNTGHLNLKTKDVKPLKFLITNFLAAPGLLFASGEACLLIPLLPGLVNAEKFALFWESVIGSSKFSRDFL